MSKTDSGSASETLFELDQIWRPLTTSLPCFPSNVKPPLTAGHHHWAPSVHLVADCGLLVRGDAHVQLPADDRGLHVVLVARVRSRTPGGDQRRLLWLLWLLWAVRHWVHVRRVLHRCLVLAHDA